jgi:hypothetical protein
LAATARSGVQSQQDDARVCAELILVRVSSAAHSREHDADVQAPPHFRPVTWHFEKLFQKLFQEFIRDASQKPRPAA